MKHQSVEDWAPELRQALVRRLKELWCLHPGNVAEDIEVVLVTGSRGTGCFKAESDLDLSVGVGGDKHETPENQNSHYVRHCLQEALTLEFGLRVQIFLRPAAGSRMLRDVSPCFDLLSGKLHNRLPTQAIPYRYFLNWKGDRVTILPKEG